MRNFADYRWTCSCCGKPMTGLPLDLAYDHPEMYDPNSDQKATLNEDFCQIEYPNGDIDRAIRCVLNIPIKQTDEYFSFGVWMSVSEASWEIYARGFELGVYDVPECLSYLFNSLPCSQPTLLLQANVTFLEGNLRPVVWLHDADHPLVKFQRDGVDLSQVEAWVALAHGRYH